MDTNVKGKKKKKKKKKEKKKTQFFLCRSHIKGLVLN